jgi:hypothetical protein
MYFTSSLNWSSFSLPWMILPFAATAEASLSTVAADGELVAAELLDNDNFRQPSVARRRLQG